MSWTIETQTPDSDDMKDLLEAITKAEKDNILMFCSTSDQGSNSKDDCYPGDWDKCIKIGGATITGERLTWVNEKKVNNLFPGKNIPFMNSDGKSVSYESGSSVATAAASGLAGVLLYCSRLLPEDDVNLRTRNNMKDAFKTMSTGSDQMYPRVQEFFEVDFKRLLLSTKPEKLRKPSSVEIPQVEWDDVSKEALSRLMATIKVRLPSLFNQRMVKHSVLIYARRERIGSRSITQACELYLQWVSRR
jgi:hypothetical protein